uniref:cytochrome c biogenesis protein transmembrane region n=1 Tax=Stylonema alsidii TaxID=35155 RepID=UPI001FCD25C0|nr:cytochrome c biogenesis protein transmembrane region [Stylonema alsidii]UNJ15197.1 cytochrome c biogenesis protein transmembrane region [Stylonema alsidii]
MIINNFFLSNNFFFQVPIILLGGMMNSLNPCSISIIPVILYSLQDTIIYKKYLKWGMFTLGVYTSFLLFFIIHLQINTYLSTIFIIQSLFTIILFIVLGLMNLEIFPMVLNFNPINLVNNISKEQYLSIAYFLGLYLGINLSACTTPILFSFLTWLNSQNNVYKEIYSGAIYSLGYTSPFLLMLTIFEDLITVIEKQKWIRAVFSNIGIIFIGISVYLILNLLF